MCRDSRQGEGKERESEERGREPNQNQTGDRPDKGTNRRTENHTNTGREGQQAKSHREKGRRMWRLTLIVIIIILDGLDVFLFFYHHWAS